MNSYMVFVYGTLRKYEYNHGLLKNSKLVFEQARIQSALYDTGMGYPMITNQEDGITYGEVYEVDDEVLAFLDELEGYSEARKTNLYVRTEMTVTTDMGTIDTFVYVMNSTNQHMLITRIDSGDWKLYQWSRSKPEEFVYFAYGSCMDTERFIKDGVASDFQNVIGVGRLENYELCFSRHSTDGSRADIKESEEWVEGIAYLLPIRALDYLYDREGVYDHVYRPIFLEVDINKKKYSNVLSFSVLNKKGDIAPPDHYATEILRGAKDRVSNVYYENIRNKIMKLGVNVDQIESENVGK